MAFLQGLETNPRTRDIVTSVVDMAKKLDIHTLAEGVETKEQFQFLRSIGCEMVQGYYFAKPSLMPVIDEIIASGTLDVEDATIAGYFDDIGKVNFLSPTPFEFAGHHDTASNLFSIMIP